MSSEDLKKALETAHMCVESDSTPADIKLLAEQLIVLTEAKKPMNVLQRLREYAKYSAGGEQEASWAVQVGATKAKDEHAWVFSPGSLSRFAKLAKEAGHKDERSEHMAVLLGHVDMDAPQHIRWESGLTWGSLNEIDGFPIYVGIPRVCQLTGAELLLLCTPHIEDDTHIDPIVACMRDAIEATEKLKRSLTDEELIMLCAPHIEDYAHIDPIVACMRDAITANDTKRRRCPAEPVPQAEVASSSDEVRAPANGDRNAQ